MGKNIPIFLRDDIMNQLNEIMEKLALGNVDKTIYQKRSATISLCIQLAYPIIMSSEQDDKEQEPLG